MQLPVTTWSAAWQGWFMLKSVPSGKRSHSYGTSPFIDIYNRYPLVMTNIAIENDDQWIFRLKMVIFHSYVSHYQSVNLWAMFNSKLSLPEGTQFYRFPWHFRDELCVNSRAKARIFKPLRGLAQSLFKCQAAGSLPESFGNRSEVVQFSKYLPISSSIIYIYHIRINE